MRLLTQCLPFGLNDDGRTAHMQNKQQLNRHRRSTAFGNGKNVCCARCVLNNITRIQLLAIIQFFSFSNKTPSEYMRLNKIMVLNLLHKDDPG